jgi:lysophospholipase L1-like esterase
MNGSMPRSSAWRVLGSGCVVLLLAVSCAAGDAGERTPAAVPAGATFTETTAIEFASTGNPADQTPPPAATGIQANSVARGNLERSRAKFEQEKTGRVAFLGGSVTNLAWREAVMRWLIKKFPGTQFDFINAGLNGTPAELGAFRLEEDVFARGPVDLLFLEFAVNGGSVEAMEGIVRHARALSPAIDIVQMHIAARWFSDSLAAGSIPETVTVHEQVAAHYGNSSLQLYQEIYDRMARGDFTWAEFAPDGVHPTAFGSAIYAEFITGFLEMMWSRPPEAPAAFGMPPPLTAYPWEHGALISCADASLIAGFETVADWLPDKNGNLKGPVSFIAAAAPGASVSFAFRGRVVGIYSIVGPDSAAVEYRIDAGEWTRLDTARDNWYPNDWYRQNGFVLSTTLAEGAHAIAFRTTDDPGKVFRLFRLMVA